MQVDAVRSIGQIQVAGSAAVPAVDLAQRQELIQAVRAVNAVELFGSNIEVTFSVDRATRRPVVRMVDRNTRELVQQIPPEYVLRVAAQLSAANR